ncbi:MAG: hypothetical protein AAGC56_09405, partial [Pseudomonadota bacterium]
VDFDTKTPCAAPSADAASEPTTGCLTDVEEPAWGPAWRALGAALQRPKKNAEAGENGKRIAKPLQ